MTSPTLTRRQKIGKLVLYVFPVVLFLWTLLLEPLGYSRFVVGILFAVLVGAIARLLFYPYSDPWDSGERWSLQESLRDEYEQLAANYGVTLRGIWINADFSRVYGFAQIYGLLPNNQHLLLQEAFFDLYTPEERRAIIARESKLATSHYNLYAVTLPIVSLIVYFFIRAYVRGTPLDQLPFFSEGLALFLLLVGVWRTRQKVYQADAFAAEQTSPQTVVRALEKFDGKRQEDEDVAATIALLSYWTRPSPEARINRLRSQFEAMLDETK